MCVQNSHHLHIANECGLTHWCPSKKVAIRIDSRLKEPAEGGTAVELDCLDEQRHVLLQRLVVRVGVSGKHNVAIRACLRADLKLTLKHNRPSHHIAAQVLTAFPHVGARSH